MQARRQKAEKEFILIFELDSESVLIKRGLDFELVLSFKVARFEVRE